MGAGNVLKVRKTLAKNPFCFQNWKYTTHFTDQNTDKKKIIKLIYICIKIQKIFFQQMPVYLKIKLWKSHGLGKKTRQDSYHTWLQAKMAECQ